MIFWQITLFNYKSNKQEKYTSTPTCNYLFRAGCLASSNGPDWFISQDNTWPVRDVGEDSLHLSKHHLLGAVSLTILKLLSNAWDNLGKRLKHSNESHLNYFKELPALTPYCCLKQKPLIQDNFTLRPASRACPTFSLMSWSGSPKTFLRSEWPRITHSHPQSFTMAGEISPVKAPLATYKRTMMFECEKQ